MQNLILIRGLPGSGKSTLAIELVRFYMNHHSVVRLEADDWFTSKAGYAFVASELGNAHAECYRLAKQALLTGVEYIIVANTFSRMWEMEPYLKLIQEFPRTSVRVITCEGNFQNIHNVPQETIDKMRARWEPYTPLTGRPA